jgi:uncharacterized Rossmann fold enzyme
MQGGQLFDMGDGYTPPSFVSLSPEATKYKCIVPDEQWHAQVRQNLQRPVQKFTPSLLVHDGTLVIVGSGMSVADHVDEIRQEKAAGRPVIAVKGAHDWLLERDIVPDAWVCMDPQGKIVNGIQQKRTEVCYLVASQSHPAVFDHLEGCQVVMWHAWAGKEEQDLAPDAMWVGGGSTSGLRALTLGYLMGFRRFVLYGFDSCIREDGVKRVDGTLAAEKRLKIRVGKEGKDYLCNSPMAAQAVEFQTNFQFMPGIKVKVVGEGLIAAIMAERAREGYNDW